MVPGAEGDVTPRERLIAALDVASVDEARPLVELLAPEVGMFKVGSQLFTAAGPAFVHELTSAGHRIFLDLKFHDIPNTVRAAVAAAAHLNVSLVDVHALGGRAMLEAALAGLAKAETRLLAITVLTSHDQQTLAQVGLSGSPRESVRRLALLATETRLHGVVASAQEAALIRETCGPGLLIVTPGIRPAGWEQGDQARQATAGEAIAAGADYVVVGRPLTQAYDPAEAARVLVQEIATCTPG